MMLKRSSKFLLFIHNRPDNVLCTLQRHYLSNVIRLALSFTVCRLQQRPDRLSDGFVAATVIRIKPDSFGLAAAAALWYWQ